LCLDGVGRMHEQNTDNDSRDKEHQTAHVILLQTNCDQVQRSIRRVAAHNLSQVAVQVVA
jgi:hypothetical protein